MSVTARYSTSALLGPTLKALAFLLSLCVAILCASAGYGLFKMRLGGMSRGASIGISEFVTHSGLTIVFLVLGLALLASRFLETMLFGISRLDAVTYISVVALLLVTCVIACWVPAWRASRLDPITVLRAD